MRIISSLTYFITAVIIMNTATSFASTEATDGGVAQNVENVKLNLPPEQKPSGDANEQPEEINLEDSYNFRFHKLLNKYVDKEGMVDYAKLRRYRSELYSVCRGISELDSTEYYQWEDDDKVAFWLNAHNILTLKVIIDNYPIKPSRIKMIFYPANSIMQLDNPRQNEYFTVMGEEYTLREIEKNMTKIYDDPRIFFALSYASYGSAPLRNEPYFGALLDEQLSDQARRFINKTAFEVKGVKKEIYLSDVFNWYKSDFIRVYGTDKQYRSRKEHLRAYFNFISEFVSEKHATMLKKDNYKVKFIRYDWRLNDSSKNKK